MDENQERVKYTPGPWTISGIDTVIAPSPNKGPYSVVIAESTGYKHERIANAQLIAAAPELLKVLKVMVDHASEQYPHFESPRGQMDIETARAAITKATGEK